MSSDNTISLPDRSIAAQRFWVRVSIKSDDECWPWGGSHHNQGYGTFMWRKRTWYAHRVAWSFWFGPIPKGLSVCHQCDNTKCCNPNHLFLGTHKENIQDAFRKGRIPKPEYKVGSAHHNSKLTEEDVIEIRRRRVLGETHRSIAKDYPVNQRHISDICRRIGWGHV